MHTGGVGGGEGVRSEKLSQTYEIKHEKGKKGDPSRFFDNPKYPHKNNLAQTPRTPPLDFQLLCASMSSWYFLAICWTSGVRLNFAQLTVSHNNLFPIITLSSSKTGSIPNKGLMGRPGMMGPPFSEGLGEIATPPVSVCHLKNRLG
jgi:hypothetical protein